MVRKAKGVMADSFDMEGSGGKSVGGKSCGGKKVAGKSVGGKPVAGTFLPLSRPHMVGGPDSLPPWSKMGITFPEWREKFMQGLDKHQDPVRMMAKPVEKGGFLQFLPLIAPIVAPLLGNLLGNLFGNKGSGVDPEVEGGFIQFLLPLIGKLFGMGVDGAGGKAPPFKPKMCVKAPCVQEMGMGVKKTKVACKAKRAPSAYNLFVKEHWNDVSGSAKERMKLLGPMWQKAKSRGGISQITEGFQQ